MVDQLDQASRESKRKYKIGRQLIAGWGEGAFPILLDREFTIIRGPYNLALVNLSRLSYPHFLLSLPPAHTGTLPQCPNDRELLAIPENIIFTHSLLCTYIAHHTPICLYA